MRSQNVVVVTKCHVMELAGRAPARTLVSGNHLSSPLPLERWCSVRLCTTALTLLEQIVLRYV